MNDREFLDGVYRKINILERERMEMELIRKRQKRLFYRQVKMCLIPFLSVAVLVIFLLLFEISMLETAVISASILLFMVWLEACDFEMENTDVGVRLNEYNY
ncbi:MAG TPA: hypothetical protein PLA01_03875 [Acetivibrio sp.]|jgi:hypothetical protein|nr:hypothetical protein [Acetivibrio sp.]